MPLARIVTRHPQNTGFLIDYLSARGYSVEIAEPDQPQNTFADLEITVENCTREQALARAAQLAAALEADVLVAPDVLAPRNVIHAPEPHELPGQRADELPAVAAPGPELAAPPREPLLARCTRAIRAQLAQGREQWQAFGSRSGERLARYAQELNKISGAVARRSSLLKAKLVTKSSRGIQISRKQAAETAGKLQVTWLRARTAVQERIRLYKQMKAERQQAERQRVQELKHEEERHAQAAAEAAALLRQEQEREAALHKAQLQEQREREADLRLAQLREQQAHAMIPSETESLHEDEDGESELPALAVDPPVRRMPAPSGQPRSSLVAYARSRDWKMAFAGAATATLTIMLGFGLFAHRTPSPRRVEQKLPFGAATVANPPSLILPSTNVGKPVVAPVHVAMEKPKARKPENTVAPEEFEAEEDYSEAEVVVRHFSRSQAATAHTDHEGVKHISDLE